VVASGDGLLLAILAQQSATQQYSSSVTYNGVAMTLVPNSQANSGGDSIEAYYMVSPPVGTATLAVHYAVNAAFFGGGAVSFQNVSATSPFYTAATAVVGSPANNNPAVTAAGAGGNDLYVGAYLNKDTVTGVAGANQTEILYSGTIISTATFGYDTIPGADTGAFSWTGSGTGQNVWAAFAIGLANSNPGTNIAPGAGSASLSSATGPSLVDGTIITPLTAKRREFEPCGKGRILMPKREIFLPPYMRKPVRPTLHV